MSEWTPEPSGYSPRRRLDPGPPGAGRAGSPRGYPAGELRVSDADRDAALAELSQHFQAGRLTAEELDDRTERILTARTGAELDGLLRDLPVLGSPGPAAPPRGARPPGSRLAGPAALLPVLAVAAVAVVTVVLALGAGHGHHGWPDLLPVLAIIMVVRRLARGRGHL